MLPHEKKPAKMSRMLRFYHRWRAHIHLPLRLPYRCHTFPHCPYESRVYGGREGGSGREALKFCSGCQQREAMREQIFDLQAQTYQVIKLMQQMTEEMRILQASSIQRPDEWRVAGGS